jgi:hypothetical protein
MCFRIKYDYGKDGSLEMRLYLIGAGPEDTGQYECSIPGLDIESAVITLYITQGEFKDSQSFSLFAFFAFV